MSRVYIDIVKIKDSITKMKDVKTRLEKVRDSQTECTKKLLETWGGTTGEEINRILKEHSSNYTAYISNLDSRIKFLETVKNSYDEFDKTVNTKIDNNADM